MHVCQAKEKQETKEAPKEAEGTPENEADNKAKESQMDGKTKQAGSLSKHCMYYIWSIYFIMNYGSIL